MDLKTRGVVLKRIPYTDNSIVVQIFTQHAGLVPFLVRGIQKNKAKNAYYQLGQFVEIVFKPKEGGGLCHIKEISIPPDLISHTDISANGIYIQQIRYFYIELLSLCINNEAAHDEDLYIVIQISFQKLHHSNQLANLPMEFIRDLCQVLGYALPPELLDIPREKIHRDERRYRLNRMIDHLKALAFPEKSLKSLYIIDELNEN